MDLNHVDSHGSVDEFSDEELEQACKVIETAIRNVQQCFLTDILRENNGKLDEHLLMEASRKMQRERRIRLKEDSYEHCYEYILRK